MKIKDVFIYLVTITLSVVISYFLLGMKKEKLAWVNLPEIYNNFEYKKELEKKYTKTEELRKKILDSMELDLKIFTRSIEAGGKTPDQNTQVQFSVKRENYLERKKIFEEDNAQMKAQFNQQILVQLNQYVRDYGKRMTIN